MATEITALRGKSPSGTRQSSHTHTLPANPSTGDLVVIGVAGYSDLDPTDVLTAGDLTQTGGTASMSTWQLHRTDKRDNGSIELDSAIYSARVLSGGSLTVQINKTVGRYWTLGSTGFSGTWDDSREITDNGQAQVGPNVTSVTPGGVNASTGDVLVGVFVVDSSASSAISLGGTYNVAWSEPDGSQFAPGAMASRIASTSLTGDAPTWTLTSGLATNGGTTSSVVVLREAASGGYSITAAQGSYALTGQVGNLLFSSILTANQGSYALTGQAAGLTYGNSTRSVIADVGLYTLVGSNALVDLAMNAEVGSYSLTGQAANLVFSALNSYNINADFGSYQLNGQTVNTLFNLKVFIDPGSYSLTGRQVGLIWSGAPVSQGKTTYRINMSSLHMGL